MDSLYDLPLVNTVLATLQPFLAPLLPILAPLIPLATALLSQAIRLLTPLLYTLRLVALRLADGAVHALVALPPSATPALVLAALLLTAYILITLLALLRRATAALIRLAMRLAMLALLVVAVTYVRQRGFEQSVRDAGWAAGVLAEWWAEGRAVGAQRSAQVKRGAEGARREWERGRTGR